MSVYRYRPGLKEYFFKTGVTVHVINAPEFYEKLCEVMKFRHGGNAYNKHLRIKE